MIHTSFVEIHYLVFYLFFSLKKTTREIQVKTTRKIHVKTTREKEVKN
jgi:hypothetical protein